GCAMIGQTVINLSSGGRGRVSGVVAGLMILMFVLFLSPLIERIPLAALVGVMFVVAQQTFAWASLRVLRKVPVNDVLAIIAVTVVTVLTDLATAVLFGIIIAAINFAWQQARELYADSHVEADGSKVYHLHGTLFFASTTPFLDQFNPAEDPAQVTLDCRHLSFVDYSAIAALKTLRERYVKAGKHLRVVHLSERCKRLLKRAGVQHA
ncbi:sulfate permease family protein, partial [Pseudomonas savastanoi pv. glycinea str. race 4]